MRLSLVCVILAVLLNVSAPVSAQKATPDKVAPVALAPVALANEEMRLAASAWLALLSDEQRAQATFPFDHPQRTDWQFIPMERKGLPWKEMDLAQRRAARALMESALSDQGYLKATTIMSLEEVLRTIEADRADVENIRHPEKYWFAVFGYPGTNDGSPWGWRVEGHHLSLNFSSLAGASPKAAPIVATTPLFMGANPAEVRVGPKMGLRALGAEDDLGRAVMASLDTAQRKAATIADEAPADVAGVPGVPAAIAVPVGLSVAKMHPTQGDKVRALIEAVVEVLRPELAEQELAEIDAAGFEHVHFAWAGGTETLTDIATTERHYFRVHGPTFIIEYDFQEPNHVHCVWHSPDDDFGLDTLRRHHAAYSH
jgi:hypothetical protein